MRRGSGSLHVFTFKEGVLSAVAHDLRIRLERFTVTLDGEVVRADFDLNALVVEGPMVDGTLRANDYDAAKRADVQNAMHSDVLRTKKYPKASFVGMAAPRADGFAVSGELELAGRKAPLAFDVSLQNGTYTAAFEFTPSRWGIAQYKALLGAIRLKDIVRVELTVNEAPA
ncbi:MAG: YceI family protein [Myxococcota bacterium]